MVTSISTATRPAHSTWQKGISIATYTGVHQLMKLSPYQFALTYVHMWHVTAETFCWRWKKEISGDHITLIRGGISPRIHVASIILPRHDAHKISDKRWNTALEDCGVAPYHILIVHLSLVKLQYNCNTDTCYIGRGVCALFTNYHSQTLKDRNCLLGRCATKQH